MNAEYGQEQNTLGWYRARIGQITGSAVGNLMGEGRGGNWSATAVSYMQQLAFERTMDEEILNNDELFGQYVGITEVKSKILEWGHKMEGPAADLFAAMFLQIYEPNAKCNEEIVLEEPPSVKHPTLEHFASSPDRMFANPVTGESCCIEIKSPQGKAFAKYASIILLPTEAMRLEALKKAEPNYYWQLFSHMMVTGTTTCYWVVYNPFNKVPLFSMEVHWDEEIVQKIETRVKEANKYIDALARNMIGL